MQALRPTWPPAAGTLRAFSQGIAEGESRIEPLVKWLQDLPKPVGVLAFDDKLGERVLTACRWAGLSVPDRIAVLGIGDDELMCEVSWPSLSSINSPTSRLGFEAAEMLDRAMHGERIVERIRKIEPTGITVRASTDTLAVQDTMIRSAVQFIREHAGQPIGVKHVAAALEVSRRTLDRRFVALLGRTVHDELIAVHMQIAPPPVERWTAADRRSRPGLRLLDGGLVQSGVSPAHRLLARRFSEQGSYRLKAAVSSFRRSLYLPEVTTPGADAFGFGNACRSRRGMAHARLTASSTSSRTAR